MEDVNISIYRASVVREGSTPASPGFVVSDGQNPVDPSGSGQNHLPVTIAETATGLSITESQVLGGAGTVGQYIRGDGSLADFPESSGGGSSVSYYLNGSVAQGTIGGVAYKELNKVPILGAGTDFTINADGYIASFITDAGDPNLLEIPGGNWNFETYFSASSSGGTPSFYVELYKVNSGGTATLIASNSGFPELIAFGTNIISYFSTLAVPTTALALTDRLAIRYYVTHSGRTITLHTEDNHLCQIVTTFTTGITALNGLTAQVQNFAVGTSGTDFAISSATATHTFNLPTASATNRGALSSADWTTFNNKTSNLGTVTSVGLSSATSGVTIGSTPVTTSGTITLAIATASGSQNGLLSSTDWTTFNSKQNALVYTPVPETRTLTINGTTQDLSANRTFNVGDMLLDTIQTVTARKDYNSNTLQLVVNGTSQKTILTNSPIDTGSYSGLINAFGFNASNNLYFSKGANNNGIFAFSNAATRTYTLKDASGTLAFTSDIPSLSGYVQGSGTTNYLPKFTGASTIGNSQVFDNGTGVGIGINSPSNKLDVLGSAASPNLVGTNAYARFYQSGGYANVTIGALASGSFAGWIQTSDGVGTALPLSLQPSGGNLLVGTTTDNGARLQVSGTATVSSSLTANSNIFLANDGTYGSSYITLGFGGTSNGSNRIFAGTSSGVDGIFIAAATGRPISFRAGGGTTDHVIIASTGAATFSSSVTAQTNLGVINSNASQAGFVADFTGGSPFKVSLSTYTDTFNIYNETNGYSIINFTKSTKNLVINPTGGNVGIGTTNPETLSNNTTLQIDGTNHSFVRTGNSNYGGYFATIPTAEVLCISNVRNPVTGTYNNTGKAASGINLFSQSSNGYITFLTTATNNIGPSERMRITSSGDISLNNGSSSTQTSTATPNNIRFNNNYSSGYTDASLKIYLFNDSSTRQGFTSGPEFDLQYHSSGSTTGKHVFYVGNSPIMTIRNGNVLIGTTTNGSSKLRIVGLPTSAAGLSSGDLYSLAGTLMIA